MSQKFCLVTPGRSGSTSFMEVIEGFDDVAVPNKNIDCANNELFHPRFFVRYKNQYEDLCKCKIKGHQELMEQFFLFNKDFSYAGFKIMPARHRRERGFFNREDIQFIVLVREDVSSTVASFVAANLSNSWERKGEKRKKRFRIRGLDYLMVWGNTLYIRRNLEVIKKISNPINIRYEDLCDPGYRNLELDNFFNRQISLKNPRPPLSGEEYVENWKSLQRFIKNWLRLFEILSIR